MTAAHRFSKDAYDANSAMSSGGDIGGEEESLVELPFESKQDHIYLKR
jgi:hypothetical protein